ncbi:MAG: hypothetical protein AMJ66_11250 [Betaproteobacteria bacterium SG8_40]|nr:MAG: hypothetical protein AMJ66_11250 [Betaproteobacteria bacterium SG8_40]
MGSPKRFFALLITFAGAVASGAAIACVEGDLRGDVVMAEHEAGATASGETATFHLIGAGWLRSAVITKRGGRDDKTMVSLEVDGKDVFTSSFANLKNPMMQINTPYLIANVKTVDGVDLMTVWYSPEVKFRGMLLLRVDVEEEGVEDVRMRVTMNKPAPHEHVAGQPAGLLATLPAFK